MEHFTQHALKAPDYCNMCRDFIPSHGQIISLWIAELQSICTAADGHWLLPLCMWAHTHVMGPCGGQGLALGVCLKHSLCLFSWSCSFIFYYFYSEMGSLIESGACLFGQTEWPVTPLGSTCFHPQASRAVWMSSYLAFTWMLGIQTQVLRVVEQAV